MIHQQFRLELACLAARHVPEGVEERAWARVSKSYRQVLRGTCLLFSEAELERRAKAQESQKRK
jgi:hypothetical protein